MEQAVRQRYFPSACLLVARRGHPLIHQVYGGGCLDTIYDLASLTKPLATTAVMMQLTAEGLLGPSTRVTDWLPELERPSTHGLRLGHLLAHTSGLPAWLPLYQQVSGLPPRRRRSAIRRLAARAVLEAAPGRQCIYSDLGFILLDWALQRCTGERLDRLAARRIYGPLGLSHTFFVDLNRLGARETLLDRFTFAPTERCAWRRRRLRAEVHDDNCHAMGGVAGHAGLFSTAYEVHLLAREIVAAFEGERSIFDPDVVRQFLTRRPLPDSSRVLGWDTPSGHDSSAGRLFGPRSVGHLGFTGTSLWIDLDRSLWVVLLTNRVYYGREPNPMVAFRPRLHDTILEAIGRRAAP